MKELCTNVTRLAFLELGTRHKSKLLLKVQRSMIMGAITRLIKEDRLRDHVFNHLSDYNLN